MSSHQRLLGIEEEFALVDPVTGTPVPGAAARLIRDAPPQTPLEHEFLDSQVETATPPCETADEAEASLTALRAGARRLAEEHGVLLAATGTPPLDMPSGPGSQVTENDRYLMIANDARRLARSHYVNGMHVHVSIESREAGVRALNGLARWAPLLLAMTANSPFSGGVDTGFQSWRHLTGCSWPLNVFPAHFSSAEEYDARVDRLIQAGLIRDRALVSWVARLSSSFPTIELRLADVQPDPAHAVAFAALVRALVDTIVASDSAAAAEPHGTDEVNAALWRAARDGLAHTLVDPGVCREVDATTWLSELLEYIEPALQRFGDADRVRRYAAELQLHGAPAAAQRRAFESGGIAGVLELYAQHRPAPPEPVPALPQLTP